MTRLFLGLMIYAAISSSAKQGEGFVWLPTFEKNSLCKTYVCKLKKTFRFSSNHIEYTYKVYGYRNRVDSLFIENVNGSITHAHIYLGQGSLEKGPYVDFDVIKKFFISLVGKVNENKLITDIQNCAGSVDDKSADYFEMDKLTVNGIKVSLYCHSNPDASLDPKKGELAYGVILSSEFPPR